MARDPGHIVDPFPFWHSATGADERFLYALSTLRGESQQLPACRVAKLPLDIRHPALWETLWGVNVR